MWCLVRMLWIVWLAFLSSCVCPSHVVFWLAYQDMIHSHVCVGMHTQLYTNADNIPSLPPSHTHCYNSKHHTASCCTHTHAAQQHTTNNNTQFMCIQFICTSCWLCPVLTMSHPLLRMVVPHWCWQLNLVTFQWPDSWWRRTTVMWMRRMMKWVDGK